MTNPVWGVPWHGRIQGGLMHLPNGTTMPWRQPAEPEENMGRRYEAGFTFGQKFDVPEITRTPEELADDYARGREWRNEFVVTGTDDGSGIYDFAAPKEMSVVNTRVGGWIYRDPNGTNWVIRMGGRYAFSQGGNLTVRYTLRKFGAFNAEDQSYVGPAIVMTSAAMGQLTPDLTGTGRRYARVIDISKTGDKAILSIINGQDQQDPYAIGWLMFTFAGVPGEDFTATSTTLYTRAETVGVMVDDQPLFNDQGVFGVAYEPPVDDDQRGEHPNCGYIDTIYQPYVPGMHDPDPPGVTWVRELYVNGANTLSVTGRVIAVWFDELGEPKPVMFDSFQQYSCNKVWYQMPVSGRYVYRESYYSNGAWCVQGPLSLQEEITTSVDQSYTESLIESYRIYNDFGTLEADFRTVREYHKMGAGTGTGEAGPTWPAWSSVTGQIDDVTTYSVNGEPIYIDDKSAPMTAPYSPRVPDPKIVWFTFDTDTLMPTTRRRITPYSPTSTSQQVNLNHYSNNLFGMLGHSAAGIEPAISGAFTPSGIVPPEPGAMYYYYYGSYNPVTTEVFWPSQTAVSWA